MRLSDAIATGRVIVMPARQMYGNGVRGCALGMAAKAAGLSFTVPGHPISELISKEWPWMAMPRYLPPCDCRPDRRPDSDAHSLITHIFDAHVYHFGDWTLDQLIDWVRSVEPAEPDEVAVEATEVKEAVYAAQ